MKEQKQVFNIEVPIPADMVLISRSEYLDLIQKEEVGQWWTIDKVEELLSISKTKLVNDILLNPAIKKEVDIEQNEDGFVLYPKSKGSPYRFLARKTREYFDKNYQRILLMFLNLMVMICRFRKEILWQVIDNVVKINFGIIEFSIKKAKL